MLKTTTETMIMSISYQDIFKDITEVVENQLQGYVGCNYRGMMVYDAKLISRSKNPELPKNEGLESINFQMDSFFIGPDMVLPMVISDIRSNIINGVKYQNSYFFKMPDHPEIYKHLQPNMIKPYRLMTKTVECTVVPAQMINKLVDEAFRNADGIGSFFNMKVKAGLFADSNDRIRLTGQITSKIKGVKFTCDREVIMPKLSHEGLDYLFEKEGDKPQLKVGPGTYIMHPDGFVKYDGDDVIDYIGDKLYEYLNNVITNWDIICAVNTVLGKPDKIYGLMVE